MSDSAQKIRKNRVTLVTIITAIILLLALFPGAAFAQDGGDDGGQDGQSTPVASTPLVLVFPDVPRAEDFLTAPGAGEAGGQVGIGAQNTVAGETERKLQAVQAFEQLKPFWLRKASQLAFKVQVYINDANSRSRDTDRLQDALDSLQSVIAEAGNVSGNPAVDLSGVGAGGQVQDEGSAQRSIQQLGNQQRQFRVRVRSAYEYLLGVFNQARADDPLSSQVFSQGGTGTGADTGGTSGGGDAQPTATPQAPEGTSTPSGGGTGGDATATPDAQTTPTPSGGGGEGAGGTGTGTPTP